MLFYFCLFSKAFALKAFNVCVQFFICNEMMDVTSMHSNVGCIFNLAVNVHSIMGLQWCLASLCQ